jgi:hypothetical protein
MKNGRNCGTCLAFERNRSVQGQATGTCRVTRPQGVPHVGMNPVSRQPEVSLLAGWPPVSETDWCLEWRPHERH